MTRVFFDTEFTDLVADPQLISIGLIDARGERTFYAELSDTYGISDVGDFARAAVLPQLEGGEALMALAEMRVRLREWIKAFKEPVTLATDSQAWDWPWMLQIFDLPSLWPDNLDRGPLLLSMNSLVDYDRFEAGVEAAFAGGLRRHHALDDARANRLGWLAAGGDILEDD